ncbi:trehalose-6-phosphate hydrolase [Trichoderma harzianum]|uniref:Trehalose-6-phosphate hydrolase n=1 Tax=Trichoderma harzianum TaxID=5544 RepID=A0A0F9XPK2_TRIHA|nr:trehalose-6-phosphate hydrolase [Trichoderma harzianum]
MEAPDWWRDTIVYQIYPVSFKDTTGNGKGDLNGITSKLPYLKDLGVEVVWLSPVYASPMVDMGYDISNYREIHPDFGSMVDWERMVEEAHRIGLKVVMDLVVNHTSDQHEWFQDAKNGGPKKDWYIWRGKSKEGKEPNNWGAIFGGSCWEWNDKLQEYYLHVFDVSQPDLNWENPVVREAVWDVMRFWLDKGCDGFRMDVINCISKTPGFPDAPVTDPQNPYQYGLIHRFNGPKVVDYLLEMHEKVLRYYPNAFTVGEAPGVKSAEQALPLVKNGVPLQMLFHFEHMYIDHQPGKTCFNYKPWKLTELKDVLGRFMEFNQANGGWDSLYLENHDQPRIISRWANDGLYRDVSAKMLALFHATGRGTLFLYQGQEIGMANPATWDFDELRDLEEIQYYAAFEAKNGDIKDALKQIQRIGRDNSRTPMQWNADSNAGFTSGTPWIKVNQDYKEWNVETQSTSSGMSVLKFWKLVLRTRKEHPGLIRGKFEMIDYENENVYAYTRTDAAGQYLIVCSFSEKQLEWKCPVARGSLLLGNYGGKDNENGDLLSLRPYEGRVYRLTAN